MSALLFAEFVYIFYNARIEEYYVDFIIIMV